MNDSPKKTLCVPNTKLKSEYFKTTVKVLGYLTFISLFIWLTLYDSIMSFINGSTSFTSTFIQRDNFSIPFLVICMPGLKQQIVEKYGYHSSMALIFDTDEKFKPFNKTPLEILKEMSYEIDLDFTIQMSFYGGNIVHQVHLSQSKIGSIKKNHAVAHEILTTSGICYLIESSVVQSAKDSPWFELKITPGETMKKIEVNNNIQIFVASDDTWQGLYFYSWQYFDVPKVSIPFDVDFQSIVEVKPTLTLFNDGVKDVLKCMEEIVLQINCTKICFPLSFNLLAKIPACETGTELDCMSNVGFWNQEIENALGKCLRPRKAMTYEAKTILQRPARDPESKVIITWFKFSTDQLELKEEIPSLGLSTFIGSVGGSLGLFLGFSCYSYFSLFIDKVFNLISF